MSCRLLAILLLFSLVQNVFAYERELEFINGLIEEGFPELAKKVLSRTLLQFPAAEKNAPELRIRILIAEKNFSEAQRQIAGLQSQESLRLFLAETAWRARDLSAAAAAYKTYFSQLSAAGSSTGQAAFNYGQLLEQHDELPAARKLYERVLAFGDLGNTVRPVKARLAALLAEEDPERALKLCEEVQLGGFDLWFGQAVVTWAQILICKEQRVEAESVLETQLELLKTLETSLATHGQPVSLMSPLAGARFWLGVCYEYDGKNAAALTQFYNVYVQYGDSEWGPRAQEKSQALIAAFEQRGKTVKIELGPNRAKMEENAFRIARRLFFNREYAVAVPAYLAALNRYPQGSESITALRELDLCAIYLADELTAKSVGLYLAERFVSEPAAGEALFAAAKAALDKENESLAWWLYDQAIAAFPSHPKMPAVLYSLAGLRRMDSYLTRIIESFPDSPYYVRALGRLAWNAFESEEYKEAATRFEPYVENETDPQKKTRALFAAAECWRNLARNCRSCLLAKPAWTNALYRFKSLENSLAAEAASYGISAEMLAFNGAFSEKSLFYQAVCLQNLGALSDAAQTFTRFLETFPCSEFTAQARLSQCSALLDLQRFDEALVAIAPFDESCERNFLEPALYYRGRAFFETDRFVDSIQSLEILLSRWPQSSLFFEAALLQGRAYAAAGNNPAAIRAMSEVLNAATDEQMLNRACLELGRAQLDPSEKLASFQRVALLADPKDPRQVLLIAQALYESLPLYLELGRNDDLRVDADRLLHEFPAFGKSDSIRALKTKSAQAQQKLAVLPENGG